MSRKIPSVLWCNRGIHLEDNEEIRCLCPPSYTGEQCQIQQQRILVILQPLILRFSRDNTVYKFIV